MISEETQQKIRQVATLCIRCRRCMKECIMLNRFARNPKALFEEFLEKGPENMDRSIAYSCNECSQCTLKCPKGLNLKAVFQALKEDYAAENQGIVPLEALVPSELGQEKECSSRFCTALPAGSGEDGERNARYLFIPGRFPPDPILNHLRQSLGRHNVALFSREILSRIPEDCLARLEARPEQILITACPSSFAALRRALPHRRVLFYWDLMEELIGMPQKEGLTQASLHLEGSAGQSVRWVLDRLGCRWTEDTQTALPQDGDCRQVLGLLFGNPDSSLSDCN